MLKQSYIWLLLILIFLPECSKKSVVVPTTPVIIPNQFDVTAQKLAEEAQFKSSNYYLKKAIEVYKNLGHWEKIIKCHIKIGENYQQIGNNQKAMEHFNQALNLVLHHSGYEYTDLAKQFKKLAYVHFSNKDYDRALELYQKALDLQLKVFNKNHLQIAKIYNSMALIYWNKGDTKKATEYYNKSLSIKLKGFNYSQVDYAKKYAFIDGGETKHSTFRQIKDYLKKSLKIYLETYGGAHPLIATLYEDIGILCGFEGSFERAMEYFQKSLTLRLELFGDESLETANSYHNIGICLRLQEEYEEAIRFLELSLQIKKNSCGENHPFTADTFYQLGKVHFFLNQFERSLYFFQNSLIALVPHFSDTRVHTNPRLEKIFIKSELLKVLTDKAEALRMCYLYNPQQINNLRLSFETYHLISNLIDKIRGEFKSYDYKLVFGEKSHEIYDKAIQTAISLYEISGDDAFKNQAFIFSEKSKAALLYEAITESKARKFSGITQELLEKERNLKKELAYYSTYLEREYQNKSSPDKQKIEQLEDNYFEKKGEYQKLIKYFEKNYRRYYNLKYQYSPASISDIQRTLDQKTVLVEYFLGKGVITIFVLTKENFRVVSQYLDPEFNRIIESYYRSIKKIEDKSFLYLSRRLYNILIEPVFDWISSKEKLIIIPHGGLYYIPFESLVSEKNKEGDFLKIDYLIRHHSISYHYSANLWYFRDLNSSVTKEKSFVGFAPVFSEKKNKGYIISSETLGKGGHGNLSNFRAYKINGKQFPQLLASERELLSIIDLFRIYQKRALGYFHQQANESNFKLLDIKDFSFIHIATHSLSDKKNPKLSGLLLSHNKESIDNEDGILYSEETFNLDLDAELIVLSSCETGIGKLVKGEGMIALNRGFFYSGARNIIFSLWKVEDKTTCKLMIELYKNILKDIPLSTALRNAKLSLLKDRFTAFPKYWSGFILVGK